MAESINKKTRYLFDIANLAKEIYAYLFAYAQFGDNDNTVPIVNMNAMVSDLETLLCKSYRVDIELNLNKLIRNQGIINTIVSPWEEFADKYSVDLIDLENKINDLHAYKYYINIINNEMASNDFDIWILSKQGSLYLFEYLYDFRINQWEKEHVRNDKFIP